MIADSQRGLAAPKRRSKKFLKSYGTPLAILLGALVIALAILVSARGGGLPWFKLSPVAPTANNPTDNSVQNLLGPVEPVDTTGLPLLGDPNAPIAVVEYGDFQCPYCGNFFSQTLPQLKQNYIVTGKVRFYYHDFAFLGPESIAAAAAAKCAADQNKFWDYYDYLYSHQSGENQGAFAASNLEQFAKAVGLNQSQFHSCLASKTKDAQVRAETATASGSGVSQTPTIFVGGHKIVGAYPYPVFSQLIDYLLKSR